MFEVATVKLDIRGQKYHTNLIKNVTPAEYRLLQAIHTPYAVIFDKVQEDPKILYIKKPTPDGIKRRPVNAAELREKLVLKYGEKQFAHVFPGAAPVLPKTFDEIKEHIMTDKILEEAEQGADAGWEDIPAEPAKDIDLSLDSKKLSAAKK